MDYRCVLEIKEAMDKVIYDGNNGNGYNVYVVKGEVGGKVMSALKDYQVKKMIMEANMD